MVVARSGNVEAARVLLRHGANVNAKEQWREQTALMWAAAQSQPAMVKELVAHGADVNARSHVNDWQIQVTAEPRAIYRPAGGLHRSCSMPHVKAVADARKTSPKAGADLNMTDPEGCTPLLMSLLNANFDIGGLPDPQRRECEQVGLVRTDPAVRRRRPEYGSSWRPARSSFAR